jgi:hypothetical protein
MAHWAFLAGLDPVYQVTFECEVKAAFSGLKRAS